MEGQVLQVPSFLWVRVGESPSEEGDRRPMASHDVEGVVSAFPHLSFEGAVVQGVPLAVGGLACVDVASYVVRESEGVDRDVP